ncbi:MAG: RsmB/NOP family class I SAM-dependent RNA methyltransferase [Chlamydiota bacterium]|nr:RsmB/NOP family class I SAM-dependent RNA methyltransferase [Chlamydiota bacterium]
MKKLPFKEYHLLQLLELYSSKSLPLDLIIADYFRANKALGSKDRAFIADTAYSIIRWKGLLEYLAQNPNDWSEALELIQSVDLDKHRFDENIPIHTRHSFPKLIFEALVNAYGEERACELCLLSNTRAPATIRVNTLKISRDTLIKQWSNDYDISPCKFSNTGITFNKKINFFGLPEFKKGFFEVQDEGSQLLAELVKVTPGQLVLDYCAGAGGKALAIAPHMQQQGQLFLHDIRENALYEGRKRLKRAGVQNAQIIKANSPQLKNLKKKMDWVLVDAPCSGMGTLRRNPDMKWRFDEHTIPKLVGLQRVIFEKALSYLKPEGYIVYATCSMLQEENQNQINHFITTYDLEIAAPPFQSWPTTDGMDGFYAVVLKKKVT